MQYRVYVRFEDSPADARKNADGAPDERYGEFILDAVAGADPGEEESILIEALEEARQNGKYVALYRGQPKARDRRGREFFVPIGLAWCKDSDELAQMLGIPLSRSQGASQSSFGTDEHAWVEQHEVKQTQQARYSQETEWNETSDRADSSSFTSDGYRPQSQSNPADSHSAQYSQERTRVEFDGWNDTSDRPMTPREKFAAKSAGSWGWLVWTGIFLGCFVVAFAVVYGIAMLLSK